MQALAAASMAACGFGGPPNPFCGGKGFPPVANAWTAAAAAAAQMQTAQQILQQQQAGQFGGGAGAAGIESGVSLSSIAIGHC